MVVRRSARRNSPMSSSRSRLPFPHFTLELAAQRGGLAAGAPGHTLWLGNQGLACVPSNTCDRRRR